MSAPRRSSRLATKNTPVEVEPVKAEPIKLEPMEPAKPIFEKVKNIDIKAVDTVSSNTLDTNTPPVVKVIDNPIVENVSPKVSPTKSGLSKNILKHIRLYLDEIENTKNSMDQLTVSYNMFHYIDRKFSRMPFENEKLMAVIHAKTKSLVRDLMFYHRTHSDHRLLIDKLIFSLNRVHAKCHLHCGFRECFITSA